MKSRTNRSNRWFIIISILVIISMVCGFASMLRNPQTDIPITTTATSISAAPSRTPQLATTSTPTATPTVDGQ
ncbi:MAG: hypothetical protein ACYCZF_02910 [Anaerolineae bacterium]